MNEDYTKKDKYTKEERKEIGMKAAIAAEKEILIKKKQDDDLKSKKRIGKKDSDRRKENKNKYIIKIFYKIIKFAGDKEFEYSGEKTKNKLTRIFVNDKIQYFNEKHPNHLKKGIVRKWDYTYEPNVNFEIIFNDPPFIYEKNDKTGQLYKTKKKIKIIQNVPFKKLKKLEGLSSENDFIVEVKNTSVFKEKFNLREILTSDVKNKKNLIVKFYRIIIFLKNIKLLDNPENNLEDNASIPKEKLDEYAEIKDKNFEKIKTEFEKIRDNEQVMYRQFVKILKKGNVSSKNAIKNINDKVFQLNVIAFNTLFNRNKTDFLKTLENQNIKKNETIKKNAYEFFDNILKSFGKISSGKYNLSKKDFFINNDIDYYKFINGVIKKENEIKDMKFISYEETFENEIKKFVRKKFVKNDDFFPKEVKIKYTNESTVDKKEFYNNPNKLVEPTDDKVFTISKYNFIQLTQPNDYTEKNGKKIKEEKIFIIERIAGDEPGIIKIKLNIDLDIKDLLTTNELINESKDESALRMIGDFFGNIGNNLNCDLSKRNFNKNLNKISENFKSSVSPPELPEVNEKEEDEEKIKRISSIQKFSPEISFISGSFEKMKKQKGGKKSLKKNIKSYRNKTMKNRTR
tara:strand:+ start:1393 stop:3276 length:1884 start_codon:yes stop_codon:yes gene_type:complete